MMKPYVGRRSRGWATCLGGARTVGIAWVVWALPALGLAQSSERPWVVVPVHVDGADPSGPADALRRALVAGGARMLLPDEASRRFEDQHSADPTTVEPGEIELWASRSRAALRHLARGEYADARAALLQAQSIAERAAEAMNRQTRRAQQVLDTCLLVVRASIETGDLRGAEDQTRRCRRMVPRVAPNPHTHTPEVREMLRQVDAELGAVRAGTVRIESDPSGCTVRVNGIPFGTTPLETSELPRGEYRVQVECTEGVAGRVRTLEVGESPVRVRVDVALDHVLRSRPALGLAYENAATARRRAVRDAREIETALSASVLLLWVDGLETVRIERVEDGETLASARLRASDVERFAPRVLAALEDEDDVDLARAIPPSLDPDRGAGAGERTSDAAREDAPRRRAPRGRRVVGIAFGSLGLASLGAGVALVLHRDALGDHYAARNATDPDFLDRQSEFRAARLPALLVPSLGAALASLGPALALAPRRRVPVYAWTFGVAGLGLASWAVVEGVRAPTCSAGQAASIPSCVEHESHVDHAVLLGALAAPLVAWPLGRALSRGEVAVEASVAPTVGGTRISFLGTF